MIVYGVEICPIMDTLNLGLAHEIRDDEKGQHHE